MTEDKYKQKLERQRRYYEAHKDYYAEQKREYRAANKDRIAEQKREYYAANKDRIAEQQREYYNTHKEQKREYRKANRDKIAEQKREYNAANYKAGKGCGYRLYRIWKSMKQRTANPNRKEAKRYHDRGIRVCDEWIHDFHAFEAWALSHGYADDLSIDRIDNDGNYSPENCRWVDHTTQIRNRSITRWITFNGETHCLKEWAEITGIPYDTIRVRLYHGWSVEEALTTPVRKKGGKTMTDSQKNDKKTMIELDGKVVQAAVQKANRLTELLREAQQIIDSFSEENKED